ncbi:type 4b pilus protein PilO2 [Desulfovibrio falkowii]|uniref:Pilin accessory protein (PilO) n=1 Tax=Desulfovibrio falkowii TaxID=3136602 RepID=A0ABQ0E5S6_9BACT
MRMTIINNRAWAVGLDWSSTRTEKLSRLQLLETAQKIDPSFDVMAVQRQLYGFGSSGGRPEDWKKVRSLAAFLELPPAFLGLFALEDVQGEVIWWVLCRQNGQNVGQGDVVYATRQEAEKELKSLNELLDPTITDIDIFDDPARSAAWLSPLLHVGPSALLYRRGCLRSLLPTGKKIPWRSLAAGLALTGVFGLALDTWMTKQAEQASREAAYLARLNKEQRRQDIAAHPEKHFQQTWTDAPLAIDVAIPCVSSLLELPTVVNGWLLSEATCNHRGVTTVWAHQPQGDFINLPRSGTLKTPQLAASQTPLSVKLYPRRGQKYPNLLLRDSISQHLYHITQQIGAKLRLSFQPAEKRTVQNVELAAPWFKGNWEMTSVPDSLLRSAALWNAFSYLPGLTLDSITFKNESWTLQGQVYAKGK